MKRIIKKPGNSIGKSMDNVIDEAMESLSMISIILKIPWEPECSGASCEGLTSRCPANIREQQ
jgi:hypothetical protein